MISPPASAWLDNRWNAALDLLCTAWEVSGPDAVLAALGPVASPRLFWPEGTEEEAS